ncbi:MAG: hypothetical protein QNJ62_05125 [Methyloceanibacter sp.]|nr:hypothetical protein [Methyloceanibacter sp.]
MAMGRIAKIADEITTDPETRGYAGMTDAEVANDMNLVLYDGPSETGALLNYLMSNKARDHTSETPTIIYGRLARVDEAGNAAAEATTPDNQVFGTDGAFSNLTPERLDACRAFLDLARQDGLESFVALRTTEVSLGDMMDLVIAAGVMKNGDKTNILALSQNKQSRGQVIGVGNVKWSDVEKARAL